MSRRNYNIEKIYAENRRTRSFLIVAGIFVLIAFFGTAKSTFAQKEVEIGKQTVIRKFDFQVDPQSLVVDYNPRTVKIDESPSIAKIVLSEDRTELKVEGLKTGTTAIKLALKKVVIRAMGRPNETPKEQGDSFVGTFAVTVVSAKSVEADPKFYEVSRGLEKAPTLSSLMGSAKFTYSGQEGKTWRVLEIKISARGQQYASLEEATEQSLARLRITGKKVGKMSFYLIGEEKVEDPDGVYWREISVKVNVEVLGQKAKSPETPEEFAEKIRDEIDSQIDDLANLFPEEKIELRDELESLEKRLEAKIEALEANGIDATEADLLQTLRALLDDVTKRKSVVEKSIDGEEVSTNNSSAVLDALKRRYKNELMPAAANAENLTDAQKSGLRREWEPMPIYIEQLAEAEKRSLRPRGNLLLEMVNLKSAIENDLEKLKGIKKAPLVYIHYVNSRRQDAEKAAEILKQKGYRTEFYTLGNVQIPDLNGKILYSPNGSVEEANKIARLVGAITAVAPAPGNPSVRGEPWVYMVVIYDQNGFR